MTYFYHCFNQEKIPVITIRYLCSECLPLVLLLCHNHFYFYFLLLHPNRGRGGSVTTQSSSPPLHLNLCAPPHIWINLPTGSPLSRSQFASCFSQDIILSFWRSPILLASNLHFRNFFECEKLVGTNFLICLSFIIIRIPKFGPYF